MIRVFSVKNKSQYEIIAVAAHQKDLNNLRLMSYQVYNGEDKVQLNKDKYGGPYLKIRCDEFKDVSGNYDVQAIEFRVKELNERYN